MKPQLVFLLYNNRSGSTFLASQLARFEGIAVSVESSFLCKLLTRGLLEIQTEEQLRNALDTIYIDKGFHHWGVLRGTLAGDLKDLGFPISLPQLVHTILDRYTNRPITVHTWILKIPALQHYVPSVRSTIPEARFLHIVRDPRAVINSQASSRSSNTGMAMSINPLVSARKWRHVVRRLQAQHGPDFFEVRYEDMVSDHASTLKEVWDFVAPGRRMASIDLAKTGSGTSYYSNIPDSQRHLHANVAEGRPLLTRVDAWRREMNETDVHLIQRMLAADMRRLAYEPISITPRNRAWRRVVARKARHRLRSMLFGLVRYLRYLSDIGALKMRVATKLSELRET